MLLETLIVETGALPHIQQRQMPIKRVDSVFYAILPAIKTVTRLAMEGNIHVS